MPADVSFDHISPARAPAAPTHVVSSSGRLPLGIGLAIAACASGGLWVAAVAGIRALFF
jgi:hypothetical protein